MRRESLLKGFLLFYGTLKFQGCSEEAIAEYNHEPYKSQCITSQLMSKL